MKKFKRELDKIYAYNVRFDGRLNFKFIFGLRYLKYYVKGAYPMNIWAPYMYIVPVAVIIVQLVI